MKAWYAPQPMTANFLSHRFALRLHTSLGTGMKKTQIVWQLELVLRASKQMWKLGSPCFGRLLSWKRHWCASSFHPKWSLKGWIENHFQRGSPIFFDSTKRYWGILPLAMLFLYTSLVVIRKDVQKNTSYMHQAKSMDPHLPASPMMVPDHQYFCNQIGRISRRMDTIILIILGRIFLDTPFLINGYQMEYSLKGISKMKEYFHSQVPDFGNYLHPASDDVPSRQKLWAPTESTNALGFRHWSVFCLKQIPCE